MWAIAKLDISGNIFEIHDWIIFHEAGRAYVEVDRIRIDCPDSDWAVVEIKIMAH